MLNLQQWFRTYFLEDPSRRPDSENTENVDDDPGMVIVDVSSRTVRWDENTTNPSPSSASSSSSNAPLLEAPEPPPQYQISDSLEDEIEKRNKRKRDSSKRRKSVDPVTYMQTHTSNEEKVELFGAEGIFGDVTDLTQPNYPDPSKDRSCNNRMKGVWEWTKRKTPEYVPILRWLPLYKWKSDLLMDVFAGVSVACLGVPQGLAYSLLAGLPPVYGLYATILPLFVYMIFGTSKHIILGPDALICLLVRTALIDTTGCTDPNTCSEQFIAQVAILSLLVGIFSFILGILQFGFLDNILSMPIIRGFLTAACLTIILSQLDAFLGLPIGGPGGYKKVVYIYDNLPEINFTSFGIGLGSLIFLVVCSQLRKRMSHMLFKMFPSVLFVVLIGIIVSWAFDLKAKDVALLPPLDKGLPPVSIPDIPDWDTIVKLIPSAAYISIIGFIQSIVVAKEFANRLGYPVYGNQELLAIGVTNVISSNLSCMPSYAGLGRSQMGAMMGGKSQVTGLVCGIVILFVVCFLTPIFEYLPMAVPAAIVLEAVVMLLDVSDFWLLWKMKCYFDICTMAFACLVTIFLGAELGILLNLGLSVFLVIRHTTMPHISILGRIPDSDRYKDIKEFPMAQPIPGTVIIRIEEPIYFANIGQIRDLFQQIEKIVLASNEGKAAEPLKAIIIDARSIPSIDSSAIKLLRDLAQTFSQKKIKLCFVRLQDNNKKKMLRSGIIEKIGSEKFFSSIKDAVSFIEGNSYASFSTYRDIM